VNIAARSRGEDMLGLVRHLRANRPAYRGSDPSRAAVGQSRSVRLRARRIVRLPLARVTALVHDRGGASLQALLVRAGLPESTFAAFRVALEVSQEMGYIDSVSVAARLRRRMVERVLTHCETDGKSAEPLLILLRRFCDRVGARRSADVLRGVGSRRSLSRRSSTTI